MIEEGTRIKVQESRNKKVENYKPQTNSLLASREFLPPLIDVQHIVQA